MDLPVEVLIHNEQLGMKGTAGRLLAVHREGFYEVSAVFGERRHRVLLPVAGSALIWAAEEEPVATAALEVEP